MIFQGYFRVRVIGKTKKVFLVGKNNYFVFGIHYFPAASVAHIPPPTLDPYAREAWRGTALLSNAYIYVVVTVLPDANNRSVFY